MIISKFYSEEFAIIEHYLMYIILLFNFREMSKQS